MPKVNLPARTLNLLHILLRQIRQAFSRGNSLDPLIPQTRAERYHIHPHRPEQKHGDLVDVLARLLGQTLGDLGENGLEGTTGFVSDDWGERSVGLDDDFVLLVQGHDGVKVGEDVGVVFDL